MTTQKWIQLPRNGLTIRRLTLSQTKNRLRASQTFTMEKQEPDRPLGCHPSIHNDSEQEEHSYQWIGYLYVEIAQLNDNIAEASTLQEREELEERRGVVVEEFDLQLEGIKTRRQRLFVASNLPF
jgi:hypothetical protein